MEVNITLAGSAKCCRETFPRDMSPLSTPLGIKSPWKQLKPDATFYLGNTVFNCSKLQFIFKRTAFHEGSVDCAYVGFNTGKEKAHMHTLLSRPWAFRQAHPSFSCSSAQDSHCLLCLPWYFIHQKMSFFWGYKPIASSIKSKVWMECIKKNQVCYYSNLNYSVMRSTFKWASQNDTVISAEIVRLKYIALINRPTSWIKMDWG